MPSKILAPKFFSPCVFGTLAFGTLALGACGSSASHQKATDVPTVAAAAPPALAPASEDGFVSIFNGKDLSNWKIPENDGGHWKALDGVIDYDAQSGAPHGKQDLWSDVDYADFVWRLDWRLKQTTGTYPVPEVQPDGTHKLDANGKEIIHQLPNADSGIYVRGNSKSQINIWCWPIGSGEVYGYRMDKSMPPAVRAGVTPKMNADNPVGQWNSFEVTMKGEYLTVVLNGKTVLDHAQLPGVPAKGPIALQHHGGFKNGAFLPASSLVQFRNLRIKQL